MKNKKIKIKEIEEIDELKIDDFLPLVEKPTKKKIVHYVDNKKFFNEMVIWKKAVKEAEETEEPRPPVTEYIGRCFLEIAENLSKKPNFMNYVFKDDMVGDGIENCILYAHNFDPKKSKNPFSYFTQIIYYAFLRRIEKEKKQAYIKYKMMKINDEDGEYTKWIRDKDFEDYNSTYSKNLLTDADLEKLEPSKKRKKRKKKNLFEE